MSRVQKTVEFSFCDGEACEAEGVSGRSCVVCGKDYCGFCSSTCCLTCDLGEKKQFFRNARLMENRWVYFCMEHIHANDPLVKALMQVKGEMTDWLAREDIYQLRLESLRQDVIRQINERLGGM